MNKDTAILIPAYNEEAVVHGVVSRVLKKYKYVVCVNDGSTDSTLAELQKTNAYVVNHPINLGQGAALQTAIEFAREIPGVNYFVTYDSDGQHDLNDVAKMVKEIKNHNVDILLGSRFIGTTINMPNTKRFILKAAVLFTNITTGLKLTDTHNGLRAFNKKVADDLQLKMSDMSHASEILEIVALKKYRYKEVGVTIKYTEYSTSKGQSILNGINIIFDTLIRKMNK